ncbi:MULTISPECIES: hypothetical protein [Microbacterium]|uniref:hypothetical protein n=1 Tax=Microbacterium TaxID=33882 RepID=UPI0034503247
MRLKLAVAFLALITLSGCSAGEAKSDAKECDSYASPAEARDAADAVFHGVVIKADSATRAVEVNTLNARVVKGEPVGRTLTLQLPECAGDLPQPNDDVIVFLSQTGESFSSFPGTPGLIRSSTEELPKAWP